MMEGWSGVGVEQVEMQGGATVGGERQEDRREQIHDLPTS